MIEAKFFTVGTYLYKYNLTVLFVSPSKIAHEKCYIYCPPLLLNEIYAHGVEKLFVRFYDFFILHIQKFSFSIRYLRATLCAITGTFQGCFGQYLPMPNNVWQEGKMQGSWVHRNTDVQNSPFQSREKLLFEVSHGVKWSIWHDQLRD